MIKGGSGKNGDEYYAKRSLSQDRSNIPSSHTTTSLVEDEPSSRKMTNHYSEIVTGQESEKNLSKSQSHDRKGETDAWKSSKLRHQERQDSNEEMCFNDKEGGELSGRQTNQIT